MLEDLQTVTDKECLASIDYALEHLPRPPRVDRDLAGRSGAQACATARARCSDRAARGRPRVHEGGGARARRRARSRRHRGGGGRGAARADRGLARGAPSRLDLAANGGRPSSGRTRVRREPPLRRRLSEPGGARLARRRPSDVPVVGVGPRPVHCPSSATASSAAPTRRRCWPSSSARICSSSGSSTAAGSAFTRCWRSSRRLSSRPSSPPRLRRSTGARACGSRSTGFPVDAAQHAAAAGDHELVAQLLVEHHLTLIRTGGARTLLRWVRSLPDETIVGIPSSPSAARPRRPWSVKRRSNNAGCSSSPIVPRRSTPSASAPYLQPSARWSAPPRWTAMSAGRRGRSPGGRARARRTQTALSSQPMPATHAPSISRATSMRPGRRRCVASSIQTPSAGRPATRSPGRRLRSSPSIAGSLQSARTHAEKAKSIVGRLGSSRSWLGANAAAALGAVLRGRRAPRRSRARVRLRRALFPGRSRDRAPRVAACPSRPGSLRPRPSRRGEVDATLSARGDRRSHRQRASPLACRRCRARARAERRPAPAVGEILDPRARQSSRCSGCWPPISRLARSARSCSSLPTRFVPTRVRSTASSASTPARTRSRGRARSASSGIRNHLGDRRAARPHAGLRAQCSRHAESGVPAHRRGRAQRPRRARHSRA